MDNKRMLHAEPVDTYASAQAQAFREALVSDGDCPPSGAVQAAMLDYVGDLADELARMASQLGHAKLATLLELASREAREQMAR